MSKRNTLAMALLGALVIGCGGGGNGQSAATAAQPASNSADDVAAASAPAQPQPLPAQPAMNSDLQSLVRDALADASRRTGLGASALEVKSAQAVTWSDGSLGCPEPGMLYTQALVPGYRILIRAGAELLDYHASARGPAQLVLCPAQRATDPLPDDRT